MRRGPALCQPESKSKALICKESAGWLILAENSLELHNLWEGKSLTAYPQRWAGSGIPSTNFFFRKKEESWKLQALLSNILPWPSLFYLCTFISGHIPLRPCFLAAKGTSYYIWVICINTIILLVSWIDRARKQIKLAAFFFPLACSHL